MQEQQDHRSPHGERPPRHAAPRQARPRRGLHPRDLGPPRGDARDRCRPPVGARSRRRSGCASASSAAGRIGGTVAALLAAAGHDVRIANSRGPASLRDLAAERLRPATVEAAAAHGEVVVVATPLTRLRRAPAGRPGRHRRRRRRQLLPEPRRPDRRARRRQHHRPPTWLAAKLPARARRQGVQHRPLGDPAATRATPDAGDERLVRARRGRRRGRQAAGRAPDRGHRLRAPSTRAGSPTADGSSSPARSATARCSTLREALADTPS